MSLKSILTTIIFLPSISGCMVIGSGQAAQSVSNDAITDCEIEVHNQGSFLSGHHIIAVAPVDDSTRAVTRISDYLIVEGYELQNTTNRKIARGIYYANEKPYYTAATAQDGEAGNSVKLEFFTPKFIGLQEDSVRSEFCRMLEYGSL